MPWQLHGIYWSQQIVSYVQRTKIKNPNLYHWYLCDIPFSNQLPDEILRHIFYWNLSISYLNNILDQFNIMIYPVSKHGWVYYYLCKIFMQILMIDYEGKILYVDFLLTIYILSSEVRKCFLRFLIYGVIGSPWRENLWSLWIL